MKKINLVIVVVALGFFLNANPASAILFPDLNEAIEDANRSMRESIERVNQQVCNNLKAKITTKISWLDGRYNAHIERYGLVGSKLSDIIEGAGEKGYNVRNLSSLNERFTEKVHNYQHDFALTRGNLVGAKANVCLAPNTTVQSSVDAVKASLLVSRSDIQRMREDVRDIKKFYQDKIRPEIALLKNQRYRGEEMDLD